MLANWEDRCWERNKENGKCNILTASLIGYDDSVMAEDAINTEFFCVCSYTCLSQPGQCHQCHLLPFPPALSKRSKLIRSTSACFSSISAASEYVFSLTDVMQAFQEKQAFSILRVCCILFCSFCFDVSAENCKA